MRMVAAGAIATVCGPAAAAQAAPVRADLVVSGVRATPAVVAPAARVDVRAVIRNAGRRSARRTSVVLLLSKNARRDRRDRRLRSANAKALRRGKSAVLRTRVTIPAATAAGTWRIIVCADARRRVRERSERNNCRAARAVRVQAGGAGGPRARARPGTGDAGPGAGGPGAGGSTTPFGAFPRAADPLSVTPTYDAARTAVAALGPAGGSLTATGADGDTFELTIPEGALLSPQQIRMTPATAIGGLPLSGGLRRGGEARARGDHAPAPGAAAHHARTPTRRRRPRRRSSSTRAAATCTASRRTRAPRATSSSSTTSRRPGSARAPPPTARSWTPTRRAACGAQLEAETGRIWDDKRSDPNLDVSGRLAEAYVAAYDGWVDPLATQALSNDALAASAIAALTGWARAVDLLGIQGMPGVAERRDKTFQRVEAILRYAAGKAAERCDQHEVRYIGRLIALARIAALNGYDLGDPWQKALDCARFELDVTGHIVTQQGSARTYTTDWKNEKLLIEPQAGFDLRGEQDITYTAWSIENDPDDCYPKTAIQEFKITAPALAQIAFDLDFKEKIPEGGGPPVLDTSPIEVAIGYFTGVALRAGRRGQRVRRQRRPARRPTAASCSSAGATCTRTRRSARSATGSPDWTPPSGDVLGTKTYDRSEVQAGLHVDGADDDDAAARPA